MISKTFCIFAVEIGKLIEKKDMKELYWITVLAGVGKALFITSIIVLILSVVIELTLLGTAYYNEDDDARKRSYKYFRITIISFFVMMASLFIPSKQDMYVIYGVGGTIDYLKESEEAKKLPENVIKACNAFIEDSIEQHTDTCK